MKKFICASLLMAATLPAFNAFAQTAPEAPCAPACTAPCVTPDSAACWAANVPDCAPLCTLNLTDDQKARIKALPAPAKPSREEAREARKQARQQARTERLAQLKSILTPEQYVAFLEAYYTNPAPAKFARDGRHGKPALKGNKPGKDFANGPKAGDCKKVGDAKACKDAKKCDKKDDKKCDKKDGKKCDKRNGGKKDNRKADKK